MTATHPFDATLATIDPLTHRVTLGELQGLGDGAIDVTLVVIAKPVLCLDVTIRANPNRFWLTSPQPLPVILAGTGIHADGSIEPYSLSAEPCRCGDEHTGQRWNPLSLALVWHPDLPPKLGAIVQAYMRNTSIRRSDYCLDGMKLLLAQFR